MVIPMCSIGRKEDVMDTKKWDVFISHASEDKETIAKELATLLTDLGVKVWYDEFSLKVGDSLSQKIDEGLIWSNFGIIIISKSFLNKKWTDYEYRSLLGKEDNIEKRILPVWHGVTRDEVISYSLYLADKFALDTAKLTINEIVKNILQIIRPDIYENISRVILYNKLISNAQVMEVPISRVKWGKKQRDKLSVEQINRIKGCYYSIGVYFNNDLESTLNCYLYDNNPHKEIKIWEAMNATFLDFVNKEKIESFDIKKEIVKIIFEFSIGKIPHFTMLSDEKIFELFGIWKENCPFVGDDDQSQQV